MRINYIVFDNVIITQMVERMEEKVWDRRLLILFSPAG